MQTKTNVSEFLSTKGEATLKEGSVILARKTAKDTFIIQNPKSSNEKALASIDAIIIHCATEKKSYLRTPSIAELFSKKSVEKIMKGDIKLAQVLGLDLSSDELIILNSLSSLREKLEVVLGAPKSSNYVLNIINDLAREKNVAERCITQVNEWRTGAGVRASSQAAQFGNTVYGPYIEGKSPRILRIKRSSETTIHIHSSGDEGMREAQARQIYDHAQTVWNNGGQRRARIAQRAIIVHAEGIQVDCNFFPKLEVEWLAEELGWTQ